MLLVLLDLTRPTHPCIIEVHFPFTLESHTQKTLACGVLKKRNIARAIELKELKVNEQTKVLSSIRLGFAS